MSQLIKSKSPPLCSGQKFECWKKEIEKWSTNNKASDRDKFIALFESLKKNDIIKYNVHITIIGKIRDSSMPVLIIVHMLLTQLDLQQLSNLMAMPRLLLILDVIWQECLS